MSHLKQDWEDGSVPVVADHDRLAAWGEGQHQQRLQRGLAKEQEALLVVVEVAPALLPIQLRASLAPYLHSARPAAQTRFLLSSSWPSLAGALHAAWREA